MAGGLLGKSGLEEINTLANSLSQFIPVSCKNQNIMDIYGPLDLGNNFVMLAALIYYKPELICLF